MEITKTQAFNPETLNDLSDFFHGAPIGLTMVAANGTIQRTNLAELHMRGYSAQPNEYIGHHIGEFHTNAGEMARLLERLAAGEVITEYESTLVRRDGSTQKVLQYLSPRTRDGQVIGVNSFSFPHPDDQAPDVSKAGALQNNSLDARGVQLSDAEKEELYQDLTDFFQNAPVGLHIVGGDGLVKHSNKREIASMGYESAPSEYLGQHIAKFHAHQNVIDGMLTDLVAGRPLINFTDAELLHKDGSQFPVMIYSNSRMESGDFMNTRCFTVPMPKAFTQPSKKIDFVWPRNEEFPHDPDKKPNPMTMALRYIASRKRPEESLGLLAEMSKTLGRAGAFKPLLTDTLSLMVPFFADWVCMEDEQGNELGRVHQPAITPIAEAVKAQVKATAIGNWIDLSAETQNPFADFGINSVMVLPLTVRGEERGRVSFLRQNAQTDRRDFGPADVALATEIARRLAFALELEQIRKG